MNMAGNLTQHGMETFNGYDSSNPNFIIAKSTKRKIPPVGVNTYAPGSPVPMKEVDQEYEMAATNMAKVRQNFSGLGITPVLIDKEEGLKDQNGALATNVDEDVKDAMIKHLNRRTTMLQARVHHLEAMTDKLEAALKEKEYELTRAKEHIITVSQASNQPDAQQRSQIIENVGEKEALYQEIHSLRMENNSLKKRAESLILSLQESRTSVEQSQNSNGSLPLMSTQECNKELESLHQVVDSLKNTVIQQRNYLLRLKVPQTTASLSTESKVTTKARPNVAETASPQELSRCRQGEEVTESSYLEPSNLVRNSPKPLRQPKASALTVSGTIAESSNRLDISNKNAQESVMHLAGLDQCNQLPMIQAGVFSDNILEDMDKLNSPLFGSDLMYVNSISDVPVSSHSNSPKLSNHCVAVKSASPKRDSPSAALIQSGKEERTQVRPPRKISQTEIIRQVPAPSLPVRSKTEHFGYNPQRKAQVASEANNPWRMPAQASFPTSHQPGVAQQRWQEPSVTSSLTKPAPANLNKIPLQMSAQSSQYNMQQQHWPIYPATSGIGDCVADVARAAEVRNTPDGTYVSVDNADCELSQSPRERLNSDRLCPVCSRDFGSLSIDQFQSHVLECFDNESGPETIVAEHVAPQRVCPMCNTSFGDKMSQGEFEKHVHSHFGEDLPGENFELLQP